ncbi:hypothetical protein [Paenibacillus sp. Marseille-Q4541]|uniref:hypothetical protein n=1 Tax=Paenibacillus sp. Marseille-Q4541 TaxID=2831522 RepID=UPI001BAB72F2|nr:hypothetical protein [Paenibacillus sp. Marseille-Q4541]
MNTETSYEEQTLISSYLQLMLAIRIFHRDMQVINDHPMLRTPILYIEVLKSGMERVSLLLAEVQKEFQRKDISISRIKSDKNGIWADAIIRGQNVNIHLPESHYKNELYKRMRIYLGGMSEL